MANNFHPKIISIGFTVPPNRYSQEEIFRKLGYPEPYRLLFSQSGINSRYFWLNLDRIPLLSFQEQQEEYEKGALSLSKEAVSQCLDGRPVDLISSVTYCSCTGFVPGPTIAHHLSSIFHFPEETYFCNISSMGCEGGFPGLKRAIDFTTLTGRQSLVISCELSSCSFFPEKNGKPDLSNDMELMRANAIFGDAATAVLVGYDQDWRHPAIIDTATCTDTQYISKLGFIWQSGRLRVRLSRDVPILAARLMSKAARLVMKRNSLDVNDIRWYIIHAAGISVFTKLQELLNIPDEKMQLSKKTLEEFGNTSSTSIGISGKKLMQENIHPGDYVLVLSIGPGMTGGSILLRFGEKD